MEYTVHVLGEVERPGKLRIQPSDRVSDALEKAGGLRPNGSSRAIQLRRQGAIKVIDIFAYQVGGLLAQNPYLTDNDVVFVPLKKGEIRVEGSVFRPGNYEISKSIRLSRVLALAGGVTVGRSVKDPIRVIRFDAQGKKQLLEVPQEGPLYEKMVVENGDMIIVPHVLTSNTRFDYSVKNLPGDQIFLPTVRDSVYVVGAVLRPGPYAFHPSFTSQDYVGQAGMLDNANKRHIKILRSDGKRVMAKKGPTINPGDTIVVTGRTVTAGSLITWFGTLTNLVLTTVLVADTVSQ